MMLKKIIYIVILSLCFIACHERDKISFSIKTDSGQEFIQDVYLKELSGEMLKLNHNIFSAKKIKIYNNYLYVLTDDSKGFVKQFDLKGDYQNSFFTIGSGPGEVLNLVNFGEMDKTQNLIYASDLTQNKVVFNNSNVLDIKFKTRLVNFLPLNDKVILGVPLKSEKMFGYYDSSGEEIKSFGTFPENKITDIPFILSQAYGGSYDFHPGNNVFVAALKYTDYLMIYSNIGKVEKPLVVRGPLFYDPIFSVGNMNGHPMFAQDQSGRFSYIDVTLSKDKIICLFSGYSREEKPGKSNFGNKILVFDYNGKFLMGYNIKEELFSIAFDEKNNVIYGLDIISNEDEIIYQYKI